MLARCDYPFKQLIDGGLCLLGHQGGSRPAKTKARLAAIEWTGTNAGEQRQREVPGCHKVQSPKRDRSVLQHRGQNQGSHYACSNCAVPLSRVQRGSG